jgi:large subunit ribosomal protein L10
MPTEAKRAAVAQLKEDLSRSHATLVADYRGLTVADIGAVRRVLRAQGVTYRVVKNRLARIAAQEAGRGELADLLDGPSALAMGGQDEVVLARTFLDAVRPYRTVVIRGGLIGDQRIDAASITRLATMPPREVLLAQLAGGIASPLTTLASLLAAPLRNLAYALQQVHDQRVQQAPQAPEPQQAAEAQQAPVAEAAPAAERAPQAQQAPEAVAPPTEQAAEAPAAETEQAAEAPAAEQAADTVQAAEPQQAPDAPEAEQAAEAPAAEQAAETEQAAEGPAAEQAPEGEEA